MRNCWSSRFSINGPSWSGVAWIDLNHETDIRATANRAATARPGREGGKSNHHQGCASKGAPRAVCCANDRADRPRLCTGGGAADGAPRDEAAPGRATRCRLEKSRGGLDARRSAADCKVTPTIFEGMFRMSDACQRSYLLCPELFHMPCATVRSSPLALALDQL